MKSDYEERKQRRIERYRELADKNAQEASNRFQRARDELAPIPFGQPILVGHHSEGRHRAALKRHDNNMRKGCEATDKAKHYEGRAHAAEMNTAISSDDPNAVAKLREKIEAAEQKQARMKAANKLVKKGDHAALAELLECSIETATKFATTPDFAGRFGYPAYELTNNNANIRRMKQRLQTLEAAEQAESKEYTINGVRVIENVEDNRLQIFFDTIPAPEIRQRLKSRGFRWARSVGAWQRQLNNSARWGAKWALTETT